MNLGTLSLKEKKNEMGVEDQKQAIVKMRKSSTAKSCDLRANLKRM